MSSLPTQSQNLLHTLARSAEDAWKDFSMTVNGQTLLSTPEMPPEMRVKLAFIHGSIMAQTSSVAAFIQEGMTAHLLPQRRIVWHPPTRLEAMTDGQTMPSLIFISQPPLHADSPTKHYIHQGWAMKVAPEPDLYHGDGPTAPQVKFYSDLGGEKREVNCVLAWVELKDIIATFIH